MFNWMPEAWPWECLHEESTPHTSCTANQVARASVLSLYLADQPEHPASARSTIPFFAPGDFAIACPTMTMSIAIQAALEDPWAGGDLINHPRLSSRLHPQHSESIKLHFVHIHLTPRCLSHIPTRAANQSPAHGVRLIIHLTCPSHLLFAPRTLTTSNSGRHRGITSFLGDLRGSIVSSAAPYSRWSPRRLARVRACRGGHRHHCARRARAHIGGSSVDVKLVVRITVTVPSSTNLPARCVHLGSGGVRFLCPDAQLWERRACRPPRPRIMLYNRLFASDAFLVGSRQRCAGAAPARQLPGAAPI
ncbi:hypothetical protein FB451DRAFT_1555709 [Mycena latifolia]|nr:hypothetical protein FB451DRAFT_1555709 [Mycena latifolia]